MADNPFSKNVARSILLDDDDFRRFEEYCCELFTFHDGMTYLPTSRSHDRARDGRSSTFDPRRMRYFISASVRASRPYAKAMKDLREILQHISPLRVRFCFTQEVAEDVRDKILESAQQLAPECKFEVDGLSQFVTFATRFPGHFSKFYEHELRSVREWLKLDSTDAVDRANSLRFALSIALSDDWKSVHDEVARSLVLNALKDKMNRGAEDIARLVGTTLGLSWPVNSSSLLHPIGMLVDANLIRRTNAQFQITEAGFAELDARDLAGTSSLLRGRKTVRDALTKLVGGEIPNDDFAIIWEAIQDELAHMFLHHGMNVVREITRIAGNSNIEPRQTGLDEHLRQLAGRIGRIELRSMPTELRRERAAEISRGIHHLFGSRDSACFGWLANLCVIYLAMCSMGLDPGIQERVSERVKSWDVLLDTHIVLSNMASADEDHQHVTAALKGWTTLGGHLFAPRPVVRETLRHVEIAKRQFNEWRDSYLSGRKFDAKCDPVARLGPHPNVILKSFACQYRDDPNPRRFGLFIENFLGPQGDDLRLRQWLKSKRAIEDLDDAGLDEESVRQLIAQLAPGWKARGHYDTDKFDAEGSRRCECDARLISLLMAHREKQLAVGRNAVLISRSTSLQNTVESILTRKNDPRPAVVSLNAITFALALVPGSQMSLSSLRETLFSGAFVRHLPPIKKLKKAAFGAIQNDDVDMMDEPVLRERVDDKLSRP